MDEAGSNIANIGTAREKRIDTDSKLAIELMLAVDEGVSSIVKALTDGSEKINDPDQLKALMDYSRRVIYDTILDKITTIEVDKSLDRINNS